ncbi:MAG: hypothetical protein L0Y80_01320 [Ignavibacteriae bacterium]|nr:hypothetical protein [Ignavibacteriota bacterium]
MVATLLLTVLPHNGLPLGDAAFNAIMLLLGIVSFYIFLREPNPKNKPIFFNFALFFLSSVLFYLAIFIGRALWASEVYARFFYFEYSYSLFYFLLAISIVYLVFDSLFNDFKTYTKYLLTLVVVGGVFVYYFHPILENPTYAYSTPDIVDFRAVRTTVEKLQASGDNQITAEKVASLTDLAAWDGDLQVGTLFANQKVRRVAELLPYLEGQNVFTLIYKPLYLNVIYLNVLGVVFIFLFFGYQYKNDPPQGAYIEKIVFLLLPYCSLEIFHHFAYIKSIEWGSYLELHRIGQYLTFANLLFLLIFFSLRLRFITSVKGEFYERELVSDSEHISRWRDGFDNLVVRHFLNPETLHGRFFTPRPTREKA